MTVMLLAVAWLLTYLAHSTILLGGSWLLTRLRVVRSHGASDVVWKVAILGGLVTASLQLALPAHPTAARVSLNSAAESPIVEARGSLPFATPSEPVRVQFAAMDDAQTGEPVALSRELPPAPPPRLASFHAGWPGMLLNIWLFGALACLASLLLTRREMHRRIKDRRAVVDGPLAQTLAALAGEEGWRHPVRLTVSPSLTSPISFGTSEICLPERALTTLNAAELRAVLAHELGHLVRRDPVWRFGTAILSALLFLQPLNRVARRRLHEVAEYLCDDWASARSGGGLVLARCLAEVATWMRPGPELEVAAAMASRPSQLVARVQRLLDGVGDGGTRRARVLALGFGIATLGLVAWTAPGVETHALDAAAVVTPPAEQGADVGAAAASLGGDGWLAVRDGGRLLVLNPGYTMRLSGRGRLGFREWGRAIELPEGYTVRVAGETVEDERDVCTDEAVRIVGPDGELAWTIEPVRLGRRSDTRVTAVERSRNEVLRSFGNSNVNLDAAAEVKLDAAIDTLVRAFSRDPAAVRAAAQRIADSFDRDLAPQFESLGVALGRDLAPRLERVTNRMGRDLSPEFARLGAELGRSIAASLVEVASDGERGAGSGSGAGVGVGDYRVKRDPKPR